MLHRVLAASSCLWIPFVAPAQILVHDSAGLQAAVVGLAPGSVVQLAPGNYPLASLTLRDLHGTPDRWITIRGRSAASPAVLVGDGTAPTVIAVTNCSHLRVEDLEVTAAPLAGGPRVHGVDFGAGTQSHAVVLDHLHLHDLSGNGVHSRATLVTDLDVVACVIRRCSESGLSLGTFDAPPNASVMVRARVRECFVFDTGLQPTQPWAYGIHVKPGSHGCRLVDNVLWNVGTNQGSAIALYFVDAAGGQPADRWNVVAGNLIFDDRPQRTARVYEGVFAVNSAVVENNVIVGTQRGIESMSRSNAVLDHLYLRNNTIHDVGRAGILLRDTALMRSPCVIANNACSTAVAGAYSYDASPALGIGGPVTVAANAWFGPVTGFGSGMVPMGPPTGAFVDPAAMNLYPAVGSPLIDTGSTPLGARVDFNGERRPQGGLGEIGAYEWTQPGNPGWLPQPGFKDRAGALSPVFRELPAAGGTVDFRLRTDAAAGTPVFLLVSSLGADADGPLPVVADPFTAWALTPGAHPICQGYAALAPANGRMQMLLTVPPVSLPSGLTLYHAAAVLTAGGLQATDLVRVRIRP